MPRVLHLYGHDYCSLCHIMQDALISYQKKLGFKLEWVDIEGEEDLEVRFGENVPVLMEADQFICHHSLDEEALQRHFSS